MSIFSLRAWMWSTLNRNPAPESQKQRSVRETHAAELVQHLLHAHNAFGHRQLERFHGYWEALMRVLRPSPVSVFHHYRIDPDRKLEREQKGRGHKHDRCVAGIALNTSRSHPALTVRAAHDLSNVVNLQSAPKAGTDLLRQPKPTTAQIWIGRCNQTANNVACFEPALRSPSPQLPPSASASAASSLAATSAASGGAQLFCVQLQFSEAEAAALAIDAKREDKRKGKSKGEPKGERKGTSKCESTAPSKIEDTELVKSFEKWQKLYPSLSKHFGNTPCVFYHMTIV
jgi:hypothetical protein